MSKVQKLTPTVAKILAERIAKEVNEKKKESVKELVAELQDRINTDPDVLKGLKLLKDIVAINEKLSKKYNAKYFNNSYKKNDIIATNTDHTKFVQDYKLVAMNKVEPELVKNELLLESFFSDGVNPEQIIQQYVAKYTK